MSSQLINFANEDFYAYPNSALYWKRLNIIIVADLHLGKSISFAKQKQFLPPYDTKETLAKLFRCINEFEPSKLIIVGDLIHDMFSINSFQEKDYQNLYKYTKNTQFIWVKGNHDYDVEIKGFNKVLSYKIEQIIFNHIPIKNTNFQICGHYHPKAKISHRGKSIYKSSFVHNDKLLILPSFGTLTGGLNINQEPLRGLLGKRIKIFPVGDSKVYKL